MVSSGWSEISGATAKAVALFLWRNFPPPRKNLAAERCARDNTQIIPVGGRSMCPPLSRWNKAGATGNGYRAGWFNSRRGFSCISGLSRKGMGRCGRHP